MTDPITLAVQNKKTSPTAPSVVKGFTNAELEAAIQKSYAANPDSTFGPSREVDYSLAMGPFGPDSGGAPAEPSEMTINWRTWLEDWGFPSDVINTLDRMARQYTPSQNELFAKEAIMYLRGTDWHKNTFVGFAEGYKSGLFADEKGYRMYTQGANDLAQRYYGRGISTPELLDNFKAGFNLDRYGRELDAGAFVNANRNDFQYLGGAFGEGRFSEDDLLSMGREKAGIGNALGQGLLNKVQQAQQRLARIFQGTLATGDMAKPQTSAAGTTLSDVGR